MYTDSEQVLTGELELGLVSGSHRFSAHDERGHPASSDDDCDLRRRKAPTAGRNCRVLM